MNIQCLLKAEGSLNAKVSCSYDNHEIIMLCEDEASGLKAIIAVHNTNLGPAVGGCRMYPYANQQQALEDVLRLSRGMTYKSALAGLPMGGGKAVIIGDPATDKSPEIFKAMSQFIDSLNGKYITAEDSGISVADLKLVASHTDHVLGVTDQQEFGGDPSPLTAFGVFTGIKAAVAHQYGKHSLDDICIAVQGAGLVGRYLIQLLHEAGAITKVCDVNSTNLRKAKELGAEIVEVDDIITTEADVFAPCAMGAILNDQSILLLSAKIVAGGANNQLENSAHAATLKGQGILYAPDFVINAGGIIEVCRQMQGSSMQDCRKKIAEIADTLTTIFKHSQETGKTTAHVAELIAEQRFNRKLTNNRVSSAA